MKKMRANFTCWISYYAAPGPALLVFLEAAYLRSFSAFRFGKSILSSFRKKDVFELLRLKFAIKLKTRGTFCDNLWSTSGGMVFFCVQHIQTLHRVNDLDQNNLIGWLLQPEPTISSLGAIDESAF